jgi:hypothetical protein
MRYDSGDMDAYAVYLHRLPLLGKWLADSDWSDTYADYYAHVCSTITESLEYDGRDAISGLPNPARFAITRGLIDQFVSTQEINGKIRSPTIFVKTGQT